MAIIGDAGGQVIGFRFLGNIQQWIKEATEAWITKYCRVAQAAETTTRVGDLDPLHSPATSGTRPELGKLSDSRLMDSVMKPRNGDPIRINTETGKVVDGNGRAYELLRRAADPNSRITQDTRVPYVPHTPDNFTFPILK
jgi:hypothetical protein